MAPGKSSEKVEKSPGRDLQGSLRRSPRTQGPVDSSEDLRGKREQKEKVDVSGTRHSFRTHGFVGGVVVSCWTSLRLVARLYLARTHTHTRTRLLPHHTDKHTRT